MKTLGICLVGTFLNADSAFDTHAARRLCFNHRLVPNIAENKRGRKPLFDAELYKGRFVSERSFAWIDKFRALLIRFDRKDAHFLAAHHIVFAMINLRHIFAQKV